MRKIRPIFKNLVGYMSLSLLVIERETDDFKIGGRHLELYFMFQAYAPFDAVIEEFDVRG
jgi:hypothetical protein